MGGKNVLFEFVLISLYLFYIINGGDENILDFNNSKICIPFRFCAYTKTPLHKFFRTDGLGSYRSHGALVKIR